MADNAQAPATATAGGGQPDKNAPETPAIGGGVDLKQVMDRLETLGKTLESERSQRENLRSLHDRQMTELRQTLAKSGRGQETDDGEGDGATPAAPSAPRISARELESQRDNAIMRFRQENPDWQDYWSDIEQIGSDQTKAAPFVRYRTDPDSGELVPNFYASLKDIKSHLELQRLRTKLSAGEAANQQASANSNQARADAGVIGGTSASIPAETLGADYNKLSYNDKIKRLAKLGLIDVDPGDPPEALR